MKPIDIKLFDQRTLKRNLEKGLLKEDDYQKYLKSLPNDEDNFETVPFDEDEVVLEEDPSDI